jgi:hypothetical protein
VDAAGASDFFVKGRVQAKSTISAINPNATFLIAVPIISVHPVQRARDHAGFARVAPCADNRFPRDFPVVALPAELALEDDFFHVDIVGTGLHFEDRGMTDLAFEFDAMNPVRKDDRGHPALFGLAIEHHVPVKPLDGLAGKEPYPGAHEKCCRDRNSNCSLHPPLSLLSVTWLYGISRSFFALKIPTNGRSDGGNS